MNTFPSMEKQFQSAYSQMFGAASYINKAKIFKLLAMMMILTRVCRSTCIYTKRIQDEQKGKLEKHILM